MYVCDLRQDTGGHWFIRIDDDKPDKSVKTEGIERTQQGLKRAKAEGKKLGRPEAKGTTASVQHLKARDMTQAAAELGIGIATVKRHWNKS